MKTGLVLEGGAMRGLFSAGIIDVLMENNIYTDGTIGVSAGAVFGCNYKSRQIGRPIRYNIRFCKEPRYCSVRSLIKTGDIYGAEFCYKTLPERLDKFDIDAFKKSEMDFYMVCTDIKNARPVYYKATDGGERDLEYMRASASMPLVSTVINIDDMEFLDGGITDPIPLKYFQSIGYKKNIVILTQPRGYEKKPGKSLLIMKMLMKKYPRLVEAMEKRPGVYNKTLRYIRDEECKGTTLVIAPPAKLDVGKIEHNPLKLMATYSLGRETAISMLDDIKAFLGENQT